MDELRHARARDGSDTAETFFVLAEPGGELMPGRALHRSLTCGYLWAGTRYGKREVAVVVGMPDHFLENGGHCICSHCSLG